MSDTSLATTEQTQPSTRQRSPALSSRVKRAVELMIWDGLYVVDAAKQVGLTGYAMRLALAKPPVLAYLKAQQQVLRSSEGPRSIHRLAQIRDAADNMPAVNAAVRLLADDDSSIKSSTSSATPGVVIHIVTRPQSEQMRDVTPKPLITQERDILSENMSTPNE